MTIAHLSQPTTGLTNILQWFPFLNKETSANGEQTLTLQNDLMDSTASWPLPLQEVQPPPPGSPFSRSSTSSWRETASLESQDQTTDEADDDERVIIILEWLAREGDAVRFAAICERINWETYSAEDIVRGVRLALEAGAHRTARWLATLGAERHPGHAELQKAAHILAPPRVACSDTPADISPARNMQWLRTHGEPYRGQWVALRNGQLLAAAHTYNELIRQIGNPKGTNILVTRVY